MNTPIVAINLGIERMGGPSAAARLLGVSASAVTNWRIREKVPPEYAPLFAKYGHVSVSVICPSVPWHEVNTKETAA